MRREPPNILNIDLLPDRSVHVIWDLTYFYGLSDDRSLLPKPPDKTQVKAGLWDSGLMPGDTRQADVPTEFVQPFEGQVLGITVMFWWVDGPDWPLTAAGSVYIPGTAPSTPGGLIPPRPPILTEKGRHPKTLYADNRITIDWAAPPRVGRESMYGRIHITWGPDEDPAQHKSEHRVRDVTYKGEFTTDHPLRPAHGYRFLFKAESNPRNLTAESEIRLTSIDNFRTARAFLTASGHPPPTGFRAHTQGFQSLRALMGI